MGGRAKDTEGPMSLDAIWDAVSRVADHDSIRGKIDYARSDGTGLLTFELNGEPYTVDVYRSEDAGRSRSGERESVTLPGGITGEVWDVDEVLDRFPEEEDDLHPLPTYGDIRWCGVCARTERFENGRGWRHFAVKPWETKTVPIHRAAATHDTDE